MRTKFLSSFVIWAVLGGPVWAWTITGGGCSSQTSTINTMVLQSPCSPTIVTANQKVAASLQNVAITDANITIPASSTFLMKVQAPGMVNVEVWTHGTLLAHLTDDGLGVFSGTVDLSKEFGGPLDIGIFAFNAAIGDPNYTVELAARATVFLSPSALWSQSWQHIPAQAAGMTIAWIDRFASLSASPCKPGTGTWPTCTKPTAADGFTWYENKPGGGDFGDAAFEHTDSSLYNPYTIKQGFLRIRSTYDPAYVDPYGFHRHWRSGLLASAFPDGSSNIPMGNGYYEVSALVPVADTGPSNKAASGGTWPAFWMLTRNALQTPGTGAIEEDITEQYGNDPSFTQAVQHIYGGATGPGTFIWKGHPFDLTWGFHRYGLLVTDTTVTAYLDDVAMGSLQKAQLVGNVAPQWFVLLDLAMGGGWPDNAPPAGYYDMWINYVRYLAP